MASLPTQNKDLDDLLDRIPKPPGPPRLNYEIKSNRNMIRVFQLMTKGCDLFEISDRLNLSPRMISNYKKKIKEIFGDFKENLDNQTLYLEIQRTKSSIASDIELLKQIAIDKNTPSEQKLDAVKASISTKMLLLRIEFDGMKAIMELEDLSKRNKLIINDFNNDASRSINYLDLAKDSVEKENNNINNNDNNHIESDRQQEERRSAVISEQSIINNDSPINADGNESTQSINERVSRQKEDSNTEQSGEQYTSKTGILVDSRQHDNIISKESNFQV